MIRLATCIAFVVALASCGAQESIDHSTEALTPASYNIGNSSTVNTTTGFTVAYMSKEGQLPRQPDGMESTASAWSDTWYVDNGGLCVLGPDGVHGTGDLNRIRFYLYRINMYGAGDYYDVRVDMFYTDGAGGCTYVERFVGLYGNSKDHVDIVYAGNAVQITLKNPAGAVTAQTWNTAWVFPAGTMPTKVHSPQMTLGMDTSQAYGGCMRDVPDYDDPTSDTGHWREHNTFGATAPSFATYPSSPTSNAHCSLTTVQYRSNFYDQIQWHVDGF